MCRTHGKALTETDPPRCPEGHACHTWHVADMRQKVIIHEAGRRGEKLEAKEPPPTLLRYCARCDRDMSVVMRYVDERSNRKVPVCGKCGYLMFKRRGKYNAVRTPDVTGKIRASKREAKRGNDLYLLQEVRQITNLRFANDKPRCKYDLDVYGNRAVDKLLAAIAALKGSEEFVKLVDDVRRSLTHITTYTPDFLYTDKGGINRVEDSKGFITSEYRMKKKLMKAIHGVDILES